MPPFDPTTIASFGWRQGAVLGPRLINEARTRAPENIHIDERDWLIVTSHDCDVVNHRLENEPGVELLRGEPVSQNPPEKLRAWGRNPRVLQLSAKDDLVLQCRVQERWTLPRELLCLEPPADRLNTKECRLIAEWLAKRYIRAGFPSAFDERWRSKLNKWTRLLQKRSEWIQGVYLRLDTLAERGIDEPYQCHLIVAAPLDAKSRPDWARQRATIEQEVESFWEQFNPSIQCVGVEVSATDDITLADIEPYQRFDADWVSFEDDTPTIPITADLRSSYDGH